MRPDTQYPQGRRGPELPAAFFVRREVACVPHAITPPWDGAPGSWPCAACTRTTGPTGRSPRPCRTCPPRPSGRRRHLVSLVTSGLVEVAGYAILRSSVRRRYALSVLAERKPERKAGDAALALGRILLTGSR